MSDFVRIVKICALSLAVAGGVTQASVAFELRGKVMSEKGQPLAGALVVIESAGPRAGRSLAGPWCHPDCGKFTMSGPDGTFVLETEQSLWLFTLHIEAEGYLPRVDLADVRAEKPAEIMMVAENHPNCRTVGQVLLPDGTPANGATVDVRASLPIVPQSEPFPIDEQVRTDVTGKFVIHSQQPLKRLMAKVDQPGTMDRVVFTLQPGEHQNILQLTTGTTVSGRVLHQARPVSGVVVALTPADPTAPRNVIGAYEATSDDDGQFTFHNVHPKMTFRLYTRMESLRERNLAAITRQVRSPMEGQAVETGELNLHPAHVIHGRVATHTDELPPPGTRIIVERIDLLDAQSTTVDSQGYFELRGLPSEPVALSIEMPQYKLSPLNKSLDTAHGAALVGRVDEDLCSIVLVHQGTPPPRIAHRYYYRHDGSVRRVAEDLQQQQLLTKPLVGLPPAIAARLGLADTVDR